MLNFIINYFDLQGYIDGTEKFDIYEFFGMEDITKGDKLIIKFLAIFTIAIVSLCYVVTKL